MFGTNEITKPFLQKDGSLVVNDIFYTLQGEGPDAGRPAIFVRLAKCNLRCYFCDTEFESGKAWPVGDLLNKVVGIAQEHDCKLVVLTGGEPLLQNIFPFVHGLNVHQIGVSIETAGITWEDEELSYLFKRSRAHSPYGNMIVCSPKTGRLNQHLALHIYALKYIINVGDVDPEDGLPNMSTQVKGKTVKIARPDQAPHAEVYVQAMDVGDETQNQRNLLLAATIAMNEGYRLSVQLHKLAQLP
jgi:7-carboxy-7-deazaguanine synthase